MDGKRRAEIERATALRKSRYSEYLRKKQPQERPVLTNLETASVHDYFGQSPDHMLAGIHELDNYLSCFSGPLDECILLSNKVIDSFYAECTGLVPSERRRRANWLKKEMRRRFLDDATQPSV